MSPAKLKKIDFLLNFWHLATMDSIEAEFFAKWGGPEPPQPVKAPRRKRFRTTLETVQESPDDK